MSPNSTLRPHRGVLVLTIGIVGIVLGCFPVGVVAWILGRGDLKAMEAGEMDPSGRGLTLAGKILGIVSVTLSVALILMITFVTAIGTKVRTRVPDRVQPQSETVPDPAPNPR